jgi:hypothetical protein
MSHDSDIIGTTVLALSDDIYTAYQNATGGVLDHTGFLFITRDKFNELKDLTFTISGVCI